MNVILIVVDTLRADHLGCYGYFRKTSPVIDDLAEEGVLFEDFHASAIPTGPGFTSIITGLYAINHKFYVTPYCFPNIMNFDDDIPTLAEIIWENGGYTTVALDNLINFRSHMKQFVRGYEYYINVSRNPFWNDKRTTQGTINERLIPWIKHHAKEQFFAFVHYWEPHCPYNQPQEYRHLFRHQKGDLSDLKVLKAKAGYSYVPGWGKTGNLWEEEEVKRSIRIPDKGKSGPMTVSNRLEIPHTAERTIDLYDGEIRYVDHLISQILDVLQETKTLNDTVIIITSDHGEELGQHEISGEKMYGHVGLHEPVVFVPLILWQPKILPKGKRIKGFAQHVDIVPTILDLMGTKKRPKLDGKSLLPIIEGKGEVRDKAFMESDALLLPASRAVLENGWKYIQTLEGKGELYHLKDDPMELVNLVPKEEEKCLEMKRKLLKWVYDNIGRNPDPMSEARKMVEDAEKRQPYISKYKLPWSLE